MGTVNTETERVPDPAPEVYPGAPLKAVAIECNFAPLLDAVQRFGAFQRRHAATFTRVALAESRDSRDSNLLLDEASGRGVAISPTLLSLVTYSYAGGFSEFAEWAEPFLTDALDLLDVPRFTAVVYRYENVVVMKGAEGAMSVDDVVRLPMPKHASVEASPPRDLVVSWTQPWPSGEVTVDVGSFSEPSGHMHIDISARRVGPLLRPDLLGAVKEAHDMARLTFEALVTPTFREHLRREKKS